ncbi:MAG: tRNA pseudouridine(55) synthase TruB [Thalassobius sp.]|nr:tRNA pseudouridine(55) synthase TruB [Thalassovita sp.]
MTENKLYNQSFDFAAGEVLLIDKPYEWTSFDVVKKIRNAIKIKKVGHAGTLDPLATGLLIVCTGKNTKIINQIQDQEKVYTGKMVLGKTTPSFDLETEIEDVADIADLTEEQIHNACKNFIGEIDQVPPLFSAVKVQGKRAYTHARNNEKVELKSRKIHIYSFEIKEINLPEISFYVKCSKGTYIRSLARDFGELLGKGAYLSELRRTHIGDYKVEDAYQLDDFIKYLKK